MDGGGVCTSKNCKPTTVSSVSETIKYDHLIYKPGKYKSSSRRSGHMSSSLGIGVSAVLSNSTRYHVSMISQNVYDSGRRLEGNPILIKVVPKVDKRENEVAIDLYIPIPPGYNSTPLTQEIRAEERVNKIASFCTFSMVFTPEQATLKLFFIKPQQYMDIATANEKVAFKGIGKLLLGLAIQYFMTQYRNMIRVSMFDYRVTLSAEGGDICFSDPIWSRNKVSFSFIMKYINTHFKNQGLKNPSYYDNISGFQEFFVSKHINVLRTLYCKIEHNKSLVKYYKTLGFTIDKYSDIHKAFRIYINHQMVYMGVDMSAPIVRIINTCRVEMS